VVFGCAHPCFYFDRLILEGADVLPSDDILIHGEIKDGEYHESWIRGLAMEVQV
jgi:hypothetical protein